MRPLLVLSVLLPLAASAEELPRGTAIPRVECRGVAGKSYALYLPSAYTPERKWPILYLLDPDARGMLPLPWVSAAAERFGWIVASSNDSKGDGPIEGIKVPLLAMLADTHARFAVDDARFYIGGFSAGARAAAFFGQVLKTPPAGVIACGAGFLDDHPPTKTTPFAWFGTTGERDFNYVEMKRLAAELGRLGVRRRLVVFEGSHEWPPAEALAEAVAWMEALAKARAGAPAPELLAEAVAAARTAEAAGRSLEALERWEAIAHDLEPLGDVTEAETRARALHRDPAVKRLLKEDEKRDERDARQMGQMEGILRAAFEAEPPPPAAGILSDLGVPALKASAAGGSREENLSAQRILNALRAKLVFYLPQELEEKGDARRAALSRQLAEAVAR